MFISIILPVYNVSQYLSYSLDSLAHQNYDNYELICIDDGSTDNSLDILRSYNDIFFKKKVSYIIVSQNNKGLSAARNKGLELAKGDYILFVDSDDWLYSQDALSNLAISIQGEDIIVFNAIRVDDQSGLEMPQVELSYDECTGWDYFNKYVKVSNSVPFVCVWQRCYRKEFLIHNKLVFKEGIFHEDNYFTPIVCCYALRVKVIPETLYAYRIRQGSIMTTRSKKHWMDLVNTANEMSLFFISKVGLEKKAIYCLLTQYYQMALLNVDNDGLYDVRKSVDWRLYKLVASTKIRHVVQYHLLKCTPRLLRYLSKH